MAKRITWWQAAEIIGVSDRSMRRWRERYEQQSYDGLMDQRRGAPSGCAVTVRQHLDGELSLSYGQHLHGRYPGHGR